MRLEALHVIDPREPTVRLASPSTPQLFGPTVDLQLVHQLRPIVSKFTYNEKIEVIRREETYAHYRARLGEIARRLQLRCECHNVRPAKFFFSNGE
jgi:hypothetical protein